MRISYTLLKPAVFLVLGASFLVGTKANAITTFNWSTTVNGNVGTGQFTIADDIETLNLGTGYEITSINGYFNNEEIDSLLATGSIGHNDNLYYYNSSLFAVNFNGVSFGTKTGNYYNVYSSINNANADHYGVDTDPNAINLINGGFVSSASASVAAPAPLPILGLPAVLFYSRKLKKRIKASREASSASLV